MKVHLPYKLPSVFSALLIGILLLGLAMPVLAQELSLAQQVGSLAHVADEGVEAAEANDTATMQREYNELHDLWASMEDAVKAENPGTYVELESALHAVRDALEASPVDVSAAGAAFAHMQDEALEVAEKFEAGQPAATGPAEAEPADLLKPLAAAYRAAEAGDVAEAQAQLGTAIQLWPVVEGAIAAKSPEAYTAIEVDLGKASGALKAAPADLPTAEAALERIQDALVPFAAGQRYTLFDSMAIILREGLEALLVITALLAFLQRSGNRDKRSWIWAGAGVGVLVSLGVAVVLQTGFSRISAGQNREIIEGATGIVAAGLLFYVSYWLHSKSSGRNWQKYLNNQTTQALATGSLLNLALLSFLAVFREGAETTVFYLGMASSIALRDLLLGLGLGTAILIVTAILMMVVGMRLPIGPFFRVAGLLVYYLGFKFLGNGIHALQVADVLPASPVQFVGSIPFFGIYPTWESIVPQMLLLVMAVLVVAYLWLQNRPLANAESAMQG